MNLHKNKFILGLIIVIFGFLFISLLANPFVASNTQSQTKSLITPTVSVQKKDIAYNGESGVDALTILKKHYQVIQDKSGLVISINGRKADTAKREFWAFYINDSLASVGPQDYTTKEGDVLTWKLETY